MTLCRKGFENMVAIGENVDNKLCLLNTESPENSQFLKSVTLLFDLDLGKWPWPWYHQMCIDEMYFHTTKD